MTKELKKLFDDVDSIPRCHTSIEGLLINFEVEEKVIYVHLSEKLMKSLTVSQIYSEILDINHDYPGLPYPFKTVETDYGSTCYGMMEWQKVKMVKGGR